MGRQRLRPGADRPEKLNPIRHMEQRNLLLAIVLSVGILIGFQFLLEKFHRSAPPPAPASHADAGPDHAGPEPDSTGDTPAAARQRDRTGRRSGGAGGGDARAGHRRAAARAYQHAAAARLDRADRRPPRRSDPGDLPRDRPTRRAPKSCCCGQPAPRSPISRNSAGWRQRRGQGARPGHALDRDRRPADPELAGDPDLGQRRGARLHAHGLGRRELHVHAAGRGEETAAAHRSSCHPTG